MKSNIVFGVLVLTLMVWIPAAWVVGTVDAVRESKWNEQVEIMGIRGPVLVVMIKPETNNF